MKTNSPEKIIQAGVYAFLFSKDIIEVFSLDKSSFSIRDNEVRHQNKPLKMQADRMTIAFALILLSKSNDIVRLIHLWHEEMDLLITCTILIYMHGTVSLGSTIIKHPEKELPLSPFLDYRQMVHLNKIIVQNVSGFEVDRLFSFLATRQFRDHFFFGGSLMFGKINSSCFPIFDSSQHRTFSFTSNEHEVSELVYVLDPDINHYYLIIINHTKEKIMIFDGLGMPLDKEYTSLLPQHYTRSVSNKNLQVFRTCGPHIVFCAYAYIVNLNSFRDEMNFSRLYEIYSFHNDNDGLVSCVYQRIKEQMGRQL